jgi:hypothetical protein
MFAFTTRRLLGTFALFVSKKSTQNAPTVAKFKRAEDRMKAAAVLYRALDKEAKAALRKESEGLLSAASKEKRSQRKKSLAMRPYAQFVQAEYHNAEGKTFQAKARSLSALWKKQGKKIQKK